MKGEGRDDLPPDPIRVGAGFSLRNGGSFAVIVPKTAG